MKSLEDFERVYRRFNVALGFLAGVIVIVAGLIIAYDVVMRYIFARPTTWAGELACFLMVYVVFMGLALALLDGSHVSVELFIDMTHGRARWVLLLLGEIIVVAFGAVLTWQMTLVTYDSIRYQWISSSMLAMPLKYVYVVGPLGCLLFTIASVLLLGKRLKHRFIRKQSLPDT